MSDSTPPNSRPEAAGSHDGPGQDVPEDLRDLDQALGRILSPLADEAPDGLVDRVFDASVESLPTRVLAFPNRSEDHPQRFRIPYIGYAAMILVAILTSVSLMNRGQGTLTPEEFAGDPSVTTLATFEIEQPRESEAMLMAVLDPSEDWFEDDQDFGDQFVTGVGAVLQTRGFGVDDLSGDVLAMLGGSAS